MHKKQILSFIFSFIFIFILISINLKADEFESFGNKLYLSPDENVILIAPDNNQTIAQYATYDYYLFEDDGLNLTVKYNNTIIGHKYPKDKIILKTLFVNSSEFDLNVMSSDNKTLYIRVHYIAEKGFIPINRNQKPLFDKWKKQQYTPSQPESIDFMHLLKLTMITIILTICLLTVMGFGVKYIKEHNTVEAESYLKRDYYHLYNDGNNYEQNK